MTFTFSKIIFTWVDTCPLEEYDSAIWNRDPVLNQNCNRKYLGQKNSSTFSTQGLAFLSIGCIRGSLFSCSSTYAFILWQSLLQTLPKAQRTRGLSFTYQSNFFGSYHKFSDKSWSDFIFTISTKQQLQLFNKISAIQLNLDFKILTKCTFRISTKKKLHNLNQASSAKYWPKFSFKISPEL